MTAVEPLTKSSITRLTPRQVRALWADRLQSGLYDAATLRLCAVSQDGERFYCALGVLGDLAVEAGMASWQQIAGEHIVSLVHGGVLHSTALPDHINRWAGITFRQGADISVMNDRHVPWDAIADHIRSL